MLSSAPQHPYVRKRHFGAILLVVITCVLLAPASFADTSDFSASVSTTAGSKPTYYLDGGQYFSLGANLSYTPLKDWSLSLSQSATSLVQDESVREEARWFGNTSLSVAGPYLYSDRRNTLSLGLSSVFLQNTQTSWDQTKVLDLGATLAWTHTYKKFSLTPALSYTQFFYREKIGKSGFENYPTQYAASLAMGYQILDFWSVGTTYNLIQQNFYFSPSAYRYSLGFSQSFKVDENFSISMGLTTSDSQIQGTSRTPVYAYKEDLSEAYVSASYRI